MAVAVLLSACIVLIVCAVVMILIGRWVYKDAKKKGLPEVMWTAVAVLVPGLVGLLIYIVYRADKKAMMVCKSCEKEIELNVSFCPYCGYQSPPTEAVRSSAKPYKGLFALILISAFVMFFGIIGVSLAAFTTFTRSTQSSATNVIDHGSMSVTFDEWGAYAQATTEVAIPDTPWDWEMQEISVGSSPYWNDTGGDDSYYESYSEGYYTYSKSKAEAALVMKYDIPADAQEISITYQFTGNANFVMEPNPTVSAKSYNTQQGSDTKYYGTYVYDVSAFEGNQITFVITPKGGETLYDVYLSVSPLE